MVDLGRQEPDDADRATYNGLAGNAQLLAGTTVYVPTVEEGAAALASGAPAVAPATSGAAGGTVPTGTLAAETATTVLAPGMGQVPSPYGELGLIPAAADARNAMRAEASTLYGIDIYPGGPLSAYRTYAQHSQLHGAFRAGHGAPANPPGTSQGESRVSGRRGCLSRAKEQCRVHRAD